MTANADSKTKIDTLNQEAWELKYENRKRALEIGQEALKLSDQINYSLGRAHALLIISVIQFWQADNEPYLENLMKAEKVFRNNNEYLGLARTQIYISSIFDSYGEYNQAISYCYDAIRLCEEYQFAVEEADTLTTLGQINIRIEDYPKAIESFEKALEIRLNLNEQMAAGSSYNLLARTHLLNNKFEKSLHYYNKSLELRQQINDNIGLPWTMLGLATLYEKKGELTAAIRYYEHGLKLNRELKDKRYQLLCHIGLAKILLKTGENKKAEELLKTALALAGEIQSKPMLADVYYALSLLFENKKKYELSLQYYKQYNSIKEAVNSAETANKLKNQQIAFSIEKSQKEAEIYQLRNVELKNAFEEVERKNSEITDSINYAKRIQRAVLPPEKLIKDLLPDSFLLYLPRDIVSGDFYWVTEAHNKIYFTIADCTGHGVPGALLSIIGKIGLDRTINEFNIQSPAEILDRLNSLLKETFATSEDSMKDGMDIALCSFDTASYMLEYAGAKNSLYLIRNDELITYKADRISIESTNEEVHFTNHTIQLEKGDVIYVFSDGYADQFGGADNTKFMIKNLKSLLVEIHAKPANNQKKIIEDRFVSWKGGNDQIDDVSILGVKF